MQENILKYRLLKNDSGNLSPYSKYGLTFLISDISSFASLDHVIIYSLQSLRVLSLEHLIAGLNTQPKPPAAMASPARGVFFRVLVLVFRYRLYVCRLHINYI